MGTKRVYSAGSWCSLVAAEPDEAHANEASGVASYADANGSYGNLSKIVLRYGRRSPSAKLYPGFVYAFAGSWKPAWSLAYDYWTSYFEFPWSADESFTMEIRIREILNDFDVEALTWNNHAGLLTMGERLGETTFSYKGRCYYWGGALISSVRWQGLYLRTYLEPTQPVFGLMLEGYSQNANATLARSSLAIKPDY